MMTPCSGSSRSCRSGGQEANPDEGGDNPLDPRWIRLAGMVWDTSGGDGSPSSLRRGGLHGVAGQPRHKEESRDLLVRGGDARPSTEHGSLAKRRVDRSLASLSGRYPRKLIWIRTVAFARLN